MYNEQRGIVTKIKGKEIKISSQKCKVGSIYDKPKTTENDNRIKSN